MRKIFGTDGVRGRANKDPITPKTLMKIAVAAGHLFTRGNHRHMVVIGKDTRLSGYMIEPALTSGFIAVGMDVMLLGPMPTPGVAALTRSMRADLGVMISASHNPYCDNGIKFFGPDGHKLCDDMELKIEKQVQENIQYLTTPERLGRAQRLEDAIGRYTEIAKNTFPKNLRLDGLKIVIDCAHGAAYKIAPRIFWELGAEVIPLGVKPDGININNNCGATSPQLMQEAVLAHRADLGIALDGDADRVVMADEKGQFINGDQLMATIATHWHNTQCLQQPAIVGTVMSNLGLERYLSTLGIALHRAPVGDRYVSAMMRDKGINLGGEQSGHLILSDYTTTGDGIIAALQVMAMIVARQQPASTACRLFEPVPQVLKNVKITTSTILEHPEVQRTIQSVKASLNGHGRLLIRKSGTENLVRIMVEGTDKARIEEAATQVMAVIEAKAAG